MGGRCDSHCDPSAMLDTEKVDGMESWSENEIVRSLLIPDFTAKTMSLVSLFFK
jgi:hypothetical protein